MELNSYKVSIIFLLSLFCGSLHASLAHRGFYVRLDGVYYNTHVDNIAARFSEQSLNDRISEAWENVAKKTSNETKNYTLITTLGYRFNQFFWD